MYAYMYVYTYLYVYALESIQQRLCSEHLSLCVFVDAQEEEKEEKDKSIRAMGPGPSEGSKGPQSADSLADTDQGPSSKQLDFSLEKETKEPGRDSEGVEGKSGETPGNISRESDGVKENNLEAKAMKGNEEEPPAAKTSKRQGRGERVPRESVPRTAEERVQLAKKMMALRQKEKMDELESSDRRAMDLLQRLEKEKAQRLIDKRKRDKDRKRDIEDRIRRLTNEENVK